MLWAKIWFFLVAVAAGVAVALLVLQPRPMQSELDAQVDARLEGAERGAGSLLKIHARKWLDAAAQVSSDAQLVEALDQATRGGGNELVHKTAQSRLRYFNQEWKTDQLIAVDGKGHALARTGIDEAVWKDDVSGSPLVAEALRGYRLDDTWDSGGKLYRVSASPVIARDKYVGALLVLQEIGTDLAGRIHDTLGVDVAFVVRGAVSAQSTSLPILSQLPSLVTAHAAELAEKGHTEPIKLKGGDRSYVLIASSLLGEAAGHEAACVLSAERPMATSVSTTVSSLSPSLMSARDIGIIGGGLVGVLVIGFLLIWLEHDRPSKRLYRELLEASRVEGDRIYDEHHSGRFAQIARSVNTLLDRTRETLRRVAPIPPAVERSIDAILGTNQRPTTLPVSDLGPPRRPGFPAPEPTSRASPPPPAFIPPPPAAFTPQPAARVALDPEPPALAAPGYGMPTVPEVAAVGGERTFRDLRRPNAVRLEEAIFASEPSSESTNPRTPPAPMPEPTTEQFDAPPTVQDGRPPPAPRHLGEDESTTLRPVDPQVLASLNPTLKTVVAGEEADFQAVFDEFLETKRRCGEPTDGVTFDKFATKLRQNRDQLITRYACKSVKFQVYVKDGKAALKATPISR